MRVFVYEYTCAVAAADMAPSLAVEGRAMLLAVRADFAALPGVEPVTLAPGGDEERAFRALARSSDWTLAIAPEFDDLLLERCRWVVESGGRLLGPEPGAVAVAGDKLTLAAQLHARGVPTPRCRPVSGKRAAAVEFPAVLKPRHGAGAQTTFLVRDEDELRKCLDAPSAELPAGGLILQRYAPGMAASVAFLVGAHAAIALRAGEQRLSTDGRFHYQGGRLPLPEPLASRAVALGRRAVAAVPGLRGYVGVDLVLGAAAAGSADHVIEINPRLTTSYLGLRALSRTNLAGLMLRAAAGESVAPEWHPGGVEFGADGTVAHSP